MAGWTNLTPSAAALAAGNAYLYEDAGALKYQGTSGSAATIVSAAGVLSGGGGSASNPLDVNISTRYYPVQNWGAIAGSSQNLAANRMVAVPFYVGGSAISIDRIALEITAAVATTSVRLCVYTDNGGYPDALVLNAGTIDSSTTGIKEITLGTPQALSASTLYWLVCISDGTPQTRASNGSTRGVAAFAYVGSGNVGAFYKDSAGSFATPPSYGTPTGNLPGAPRIQVRIL